MRAWATHVLKGCGFPKGARARAECFLADTRLYPWIPDPTDVEFIPAPRLMMPNVLTGEGPVYLADDCDGLTARWIALCLAAGVRCQIVGYSFDESHQITHVLGAIWDDVAKEWLDGDSSFQHVPLGHAQTHTWEERRNLPTMEIICDAALCDSKRPPNDDEGVVSYVGVGKPGGLHDAPPIPSGSSSRAPAVGLPSLSDVGQGFLDLAGEIDGGWARLRTLYDGMREAFSADGLTDVAQLGPYGWTAERQQRAIDLGVMATAASRYLNDAATGIRSIWVTDETEIAHAGISEFQKEQCAKTAGTWNKADDTCHCPQGFTFDFFQGGCVDAAGIVHDTTWAIQKLPEDMFGIDLDVNGDPVLVSAQGDVAHGTGQNTIGTPIAIVVAGVAIIYVAVAYAIVKALGYLSDIVKTVTDSYQESRVAECYKPNSGVTQAECDKRVEQRRQYQITKTEADAELKKEEAAADPLAGLSRALNSALYVGGAILTIYGVVKLVGALAEHKRAAKA